MIEIDDIVELQTHNTNEKLSFSTRYLVEKHFTFDLTVEAERFRGTAHFCVSRGEIKQFCDDLQGMYSSLKGFTRLDDNDSDAYVELRMKENGHVFVNTQVGGSHEEHFLKLSFTIDQTSLPKFIQDFMDLLKNEDN